MDTIYQASDLATARRREFINEARRGRALLRDTDGACLAMIPSRTLDVLQSFRDWVIRDHQLELTLQRPWHERRAGVLGGDFAWLTAFDDEDQMEFHRELHEALMLGVSSETMEPVECCVREWRTTASALSDETRRRILTGAADNDFVEVKRPV